MRNKIIEYQKVYKSIINDLSNNSNVLGVTVFGSMVAGDVWEDSDIDLFVILNEVGDGIKDIYGEKSGISIHLKIISKEPFSLVIWFSYFILNSIINNNFFIFF